jgi:hypothetical protein
MVVLASSDCAGVIRAGTECQKAHSGSQMPQFRGIGWRGGHARFEMRRLED